MNRSFLLPSSICITGWGFSVSNDIQKKYILISWNILSKRFFMVGSAGGMSFGIFHVIFTKKKTKSLLMPIFVRSISLSPEL